MSYFVFPEIILQKVIKMGIADLKQDPITFNEIFDSFNNELLEDSYGENYINSMWNWFSSTNIPVIQAWSFDSKKVPSISVALKNEQENEQQAALGDFIMEDFDETGQKIGDANMGVFNVNLEIGLHAIKGLGDNILWMYYIVKYILFKYKIVIEAFGLHLQTFAASDYSPNPNSFGDNVFTRTISFRATVHQTYIQTRAEYAFVKVKKIKADSNNSEESNNDITIFYSME